LEKEHRGNPNHECYHSVFTTVMNELKKRSTLICVNQRLLNALNPEQVEVVMRLADEAEVDEQWSCMGKKRFQRWLWHAIDHGTGKILAYVFGRCQDRCC